MTSSESSDSSNTYEMSEDTEQALIEAMEAQIDMLHDEVIQLRVVIEKLNMKVNTFQSTVRSDLIDKIFKYLRQHDVQLS